MKKILIAFLFSFLTVSCSTSYSFVSDLTFATDSEYTALQYKNSKVTGKAKLDNKGRMIACIDYQGYYERTYDEFGNINYEKRIDKEQIIFENYYRYNSKGQKLYEKNAVLGYEGYWNYFDNGDLESVLVTDGQSEWYTYKIEKNEKGLTAFIIDSNRTGTYLLKNDDDISTNYEYDTTGNIIKIITRSLNPEFSNEVEIEEFYYPEDYTNLYSPQNKQGFYRPDSHKKTSTYEEWIEYGKNGFDYHRFDKANNGEMFEEWIKTNTNGLTTWHKEIHKSDGRIFSCTVEKDAGGKIIHWYEISESGLQNFWW